jgi:hypothetical protein
MDKAEPSSIFFFFLIDSRNHQIILINVPTSKEKITAFLFRKEQKIQHSKSKPSRKKKPCNQDRF